MCEMLLRTSSAGGSGWLLVHCAAANAAAAAALDTDFLFIGRQYDAIANE